MPNIDLSILNQRQTPAFYADVFANRPAAGFVGRIFVSTNTFAFYRDNGTGWDLIGGPGTGTITGSGTSGTIPLWNGASTIGDSILTQSGSIVNLNALTASDAELYINSTSNFSRVRFLNSGVTRAIAYYREDLLQLTYGTYVTGGSIKFETGNNVDAIIIDSSQNTTFYGNIIRNGGTSSQFLKADGSLDSSTYVTTNIYNGNGTLSGERTVSLNGNNLIFDGGASIARVRMDADTNVARIFSFATNNLPRWAFRIDGTESGSDAGSDFAIRRYNDAGTFVDAPLTVTRSTGQSTFAKKVVIENNAGDQQLQIVSTTAPSLRFDNLQTGATKRAGLGISTATNNFIQGSADRDFCIFNGSTAAASPILFGIYDAGAANVQEAARISPARNFLVGTTTDSGTYGKLQVAGGIKIVNDNSAKFEIGRYSAGAPNSYIKIGPSSNGLKITDSGDIYDVFTILNNGHTTIGAAIPATNVQLSLNGVSGKAQRIQFQNSGVDQWLLGAGAASETSAFELYNTSGTIALLVSKSTNNLLVNSTTDTGEKLQINGIAKATQFYSARNVIAVPATPVTIFTSFDNGGVWLVTYNVQGNPGQCGYAIVGNSFGSTLTVLASANGPQTLLSVSGLNLQLEQTGGGTINTNVSVIRLNITL